MSYQIDNAFVRQFETEVHLEFQRTASKIRGCCRQKGPIVGKSTTMQKIGTATAGPKTRDGLVPVTPQDHTPIEILLKDRYAGQWVDKLDETKIFHDERQALSRSQSYALGREADDFILTAIDGADFTGRSFDGSTGGLSRAGVLEAIEYLGDAPDDGQRYGVVGLRQWSQLMEIEEFASSDYVGNAYPWLSTWETKKWGTVMWMKHTGLPTDGAGNRHCFIWHRDAIGFVFGQEIQTDIQWHNDRAAHFVMSMMSMGADVIDATGIARMVCDDDAALA